MEVSLSALATPIVEVKLITEDEIKNEETGEMETVETIEVLKFLPLSLRAEVWANSKFATNEKMDNGLENLATKLQSFSDPMPLFEFAFFLLKDERKYLTAEHMFECLRAYGGLILSKLYQAIGEIFKLSMPEAYDMGSQMVGAKKKDRTGLKST